MWLHLLEINSSSVHTYILVCFIRNYYIGLLANNATIVTAKILLVLWTNTNMWYLAIKLAIPGVESPII